jgi:hypothetical protein
MSVKKLKKKIKLLESVKNARTIENRNFALMLEEKIRIYNETQNEANEASSRLKVIESEFLSEYNKEFSDFNFEQKINYSIMLEGNINSFRAHSENVGSEITKLKETIKQNLRQKNGLDERLKSYKGSLVMELDREFLPENT